jgi:DNA (cytosine-5)-methyltransferase 1
MKIRTFELCAGYDSQLMALERLKKKYSDFDYECIGWSEIEPSAIALHNACFPSLSGKNFGDMTKIDWSKVADFDLLTYSTPCQSVSQAGKQKGIEEGSNTRSSILWFTRNAIITKRPKYLLMENVEALVQTKFIGFFNKWRKELESYGYVNYAKVVNAADCGVPQNRKRVFMLSIRNDGDKIDYHFPRKTKLKKHLVDVLEENVDEKYFMSDALLCKEKFVSNEWKEPMSAAIRTRSEGKWIKGEIHSPKVELGKNIANTITSASKDSLVVLGETRLRIRRLTPRELFRLMNVDEEYIDKMLESGVSKSSLQKAAGNSIVVACMERIFKELWFSESNVKVADDGQLCLF